MTSAFICAYERAGCARSGRERFDRNPHQGKDHGARLRLPRRSAEAQPSRARLQLPAAPAGPFAADRPARLAAARPRSRFRRAAPLLRGRRHAHHRLGGDGAARHALCPRLSRGTRPLGAAAGRPAHLDVLRQPARHQVGRRGGGGRARGVPRRLARRSGRRHRVLRAGHLRGRHRRPARAACGICWASWSATTAPCGPMRRILPTRACSTRRCAAPPASPGTIASSSRSPTARARRPRRRGW